MSRQDEKLPEGWLSVLTGTGSVLYENIVTGMRQKDRPQPVRVYDTSTANTIKWSARLSPGMRRELQLVIREHAKKSKATLSYFHNLVHVLYRKFEGGMNHRRLNADHFLVDALAAGANGGGRYASLNFSTQADISNLPLPIKKQIDDQERKLSSLLKAQRETLLTAVERINTSSESGMESDALQAEIAAFVKDPWKYPNASMEEENPSIEIPSPSPVRRASPMPPTLTDMTLLREELGAARQDRHGLVGELAQELTELEIYTSVSKLARESTFGVMSRQKNFQSVLASVRSVGHKRNALVDSNGLGDEGSDAEDNDEETLLRLQTQFSRMKLEIVKLQDSLSNEKEEKMALIRQIQSMWSSAVRQNVTGRNERSRQKKKNKFPGVSYSMSSTFEKHRHLKESQKSTEPDLDIINEKIRVLEEYAGLVETKNSDEPVKEIVHYELYDKVEALKSGKSDPGFYLAAIVLEQSALDGSCTLFFEEDGDILRNVPCNKIKRANLFNQRLETGSSSTADFSTKAKRRLSLSKPTIKFDPQKCHAMTGTGGQCQSLRLEGTFFCYRERHQKQELKLYV